MVKRLLFFFLLTTFSVFAQKKPTLIYGTITDSVSVIKNAHIINLVSKKGTFSNDVGEFRIPVRLGDSIRVSSIQYKTRIIFIGKNTIKTHKIKVQLKSNVVVLEEVVVRKHSLTKILGIDSKNTPINKRDSILNSAMDFSKVDMTIVEKDDYIDDKVRPPKVKTSHTIDAGFGAGASAFIPFKDSERLWAMRRKLAKKVAFPKKILSELGKKFFFTDLKIPQKKYYHFIEYCIPLGVEELYENGKILQLIKILQKESISYLKIIKKQ